MLVELSFAHISSAVASGLKMVGINFKALKISYKKGFISFPRWINRFEDI